MKNLLIVKVLAISVFILGLLFIIGSYFLEMMIMLLIGSMLIIVGLISYITIRTLNVFIQDKELNIEALRKAGLTIVTCNNCQKDNVLEDQYCIYCGERLGKEDEIQEEYKA